jgi:biopolymer transport protein TolQ
VPTSPDALTGGVLDLILSAGPIAKAVLAILAIFSVISWALIVEKWWQFRRVRRHTLAFLKVFREGRRPSVVAAAAKKLRDSPLAQLYVAAHHEMSGGRDGDSFVEDLEEASGDRLAAAERAMRSAANVEVSQLERYLPFLATTASACPFIGLFGTVIGVMNSFHGIGAQGSASLAVVAPGISEALVATAAGLGAAIPAVIGYNYFVNRVKVWATEMEGFTLDMLNVLSRPPAPPAKLGRPSKDGI